MSTPDMKWIGGRVHGLRTDRQWSQKTLGGKCHPKVCALTILKLEKGQLDSIKLTTFLALARGLGVDPAELLPPLGVKGGVR